MKKYFAMLICLVLLSNIAVATSVGTVCSTSNPTKILLKDSRFIRPEEGASFVKLINKTEGNITITSIESKSDVFVIEKPLEGVIGSGEEFQIEGNLLPGVTFHHSEILMTYIPQSGEKEILTITCVGSLSTSLEEAITRGQMAFIFRLLSFPIFFLGMAFIIAGRFKRKRKLKLLGPYIILLAVFFYALALFLA